jgi:hypothetical protein
VGLEWGPLRLVSTTEELLDRKSSGFDLEIRGYGHRGPSRCPHGTLYPQKLALTSPTSSSCSVCIVHSRTLAYMPVEDIIRDFLLTYTHARTPLIDL